MNQQASGLGSEAPGATTQSAERQIAVLSSLLANLDEAVRADISPDARRDAAHQNRLAVSRLGLGQLALRRLAGQAPPDGRPFAARRADVFGLDLPAGPES